MTVLFNYYFLIIQFCSQATVAEPRLPVSATERKLSYQATFTDGSDVDSGSEDEEDEEQQATTSNRVITTVIARCAVLSALVKGLLCLQCGAASLVIRTRDRLGIVSVMETCCTECGAVLNSTLSSDRIEGSTSGNIAFFVTRQTVAAFMDMGVGHGGLVKFCRFLDMRPIGHKTFAKHARNICEANKIVVTRLFDEAAQVIRRVYRALDPSIAEDDTIDLAVSYDGSWMTRGHRSQYGIGCVIELLTGLVLDLQVMSLYCQRCAYASTRYGGMDTNNFKRWFRTHEPECNCNYKGASGGMEVKAAELLWTRSMNRNFRYTQMLSDGDSKTFNHLTSLRVYGDVVLQKEECINHVAKRLGTALRKLAASGKKAGITLGGRGHGKLTQATITKLTAYYGKAVRGHRTYPPMCDAVWATFDHAVSTDENPQHGRCPVGADSWCFYQKALATGQDPGPHHISVGTPLSAEVAAHVKEVYVRLTHKDLLDRCRMGKTQNANESLHSKVWLKCPKTSFVGLERVVSATCSSVSEFNAGVEATMRHLCDVMQVPSGVHLLSSAQKADRLRLSQAKRQVAAATQVARRARRVARAAASHTSSDYAAGAH